MDVPHRDLRFPSTNLPPLGKIIDASGRSRAPSVPLSPTNDDDDDDGDGAEEPGDYEPLSAKFNYTDDDNVSVAASKSVCLGLTSFSSNI